MNKKSIRSLAIIGAIAVVAAAAFLIKSIVTPNNQKDEMNKIAESTVSEFLTAYQRKDSAAGKYMTITSIGNHEIKYDGLQGMVAEKLTYNIVSSKRDIEENEIIYVTVDIKNLNLPEIFATIEMSEDDPDQLLENLYELIKADNAPQKPYNCIIAVQQYPSGMRIELNAELSNALFGGFNEYLASLSAAE